MKEKELPNKNQVVYFDLGEMPYVGRYTGRVYKDGGFEIFFKNICGDLCYENSNHVKIVK
jgi:hypothetical protein